MAMVSKPTLEKPLLGVMYVLLLTLSETIHNIKTIIEARKI